MDNIFCFHTGLTLHINDPQLTGDLAGYLSGRLHVPGFDQVDDKYMDVLFRIKDDKAGSPMALVAVDAGDRPISMHWNAIEDAMLAAASQWVSELNDELNARAEQVISRYYDRDEETGKFFRMFPDSINLTDNDIRGILYAEDKVAALSSHLSCMYEVYENSHYQYVADRLDEMLKADETLSQKAKIAGWNTSNYAYLNFENRYPLEDIMDQEVEINIVVDTGDRNYAFGCNNFCHGYFGDPEDPDFEETSSLLWLCKQQGVSQQELLRVMKEESLLPAEFKQVSDTYLSVRSELCRNHGLNDRRERNSHGNYAKLLHIKDEIGKTQRHLTHARNTLENNSLTYEEAQHRFPTSLTLNYPNRESFESAQAEVLPQNRARIASLEAKLKDLEASISTDETLLKVQALSSQYKDLAQKMSVIINTDEYRKAQFAESLVREGANTGSSSNALTFFVRMPLRDAMRLNDVLNMEEPLNNSYYPEKRTGKSSIILSRDTVCGLYDFDGGGGSLLEIELARDVELPTKFIYSAQVDGSLGHCAKSIWDMEYSDTLKEIREVPPTHDLSLLLEDAQSRTGAMPDNRSKPQELTI